MDSSQEQDFPESNFFADFLAKRLHADKLFWAELSGERAFRGFLDVLTEMRTTLEQPRLTFLGNGAPQSYSAAVLETRRNTLLRGKSCS
jgi:hypothetical protein